MYSLHLLRLVHVFDFRLLKYYYLKAISRVVFHLRFFFKKKITRRTFKTFKTLQIVNYLLIFNFVIADIPNNSNNLFTAKKKTMHII